MRNKKSDNLQNLKGKVQLQKKRGGKGYDYCLYDSLMVKNINLTEMFNKIFQKEVKLKLRIKDIHDKVIIDIKGGLEYEKEGKFYTLHILNGKESIDLDVLLWNLINKEIKIKIFYKEKNKNNNESEDIK